MKCIVYFDDAKKVTAVEHMNPSALEALQYGLQGDDNVTYQRVFLTLGGDTLKSLMKTTPKKTEDETLIALAQTRNRNYLLVEESDLPSREGRDDWTVKDGRVVIAAA